MRSRGVVGIPRRRRRSLTKQGRATPPAPDLMRRTFIANAPGERFVGDTIYLPTEEGWFYLAAVIDLPSGGLLTVGPGDGEFATGREELAEKAVATAFVPTRPIRVVDDNGFRNRSTSSTPVTQWLGMIRRVS